MCLAIPGRVVKIFSEGGLRMGHIDYSGTISKACLEYVPDIREGQYTLVHAGFALTILDEEEARKSLETWEEMGEVIQMDEPQDSLRDSARS
ncbi:MAG: HypC/HybG/HupF family hydrogenase formation chaperone [Candidatus Neomarinimicrobiota bacterium]|nr:MAG: HypC/HybG/HupF family hydrogenase formation chaperone [Candidatus Neomarinimicrobiota bacterium]